MTNAHTAPHSREDPAASDPIPVKVALPKRPLNLWQSYRTARRNLLELIPERALHQPVLSGRSGPQRWHMIMAPDAIRRVLLDAVEDYPKSVATRAVLQPAIGDSLFLAEGAHWRWQRRATAPAFSARSVDALTPVMTRAAEAAAARLAPQTGRAADMLREMTAATFDVIADVTFADGQGVDREGVVAALEAYIDGAARTSLMDLLGIPAHWPRPQRIIAARQLREMQAQTAAAISRRAALTDRSPSNADLLDRLLDAQDAETGRRMSQSELRENLLTFIVAGHETTALTLAWALYLCAFDPAAQTATRNETQALLNGRAATADDVAALPRTRAIIEETLRLYPPGGFLSRTARRHDRLDAAIIAPGDTVIVPVWAVHRHRALWSAPDHFRSERWLGATRPERYQYLPFSDGPRICIGARFALQEAIVILATLLSRYRFNPVLGRSPNPVMILTTRPEGGVWLEITQA